MPFEGCVADPQADYYSYLSMPGMVGSAFENRNPGAVSEVLTVYPQLKLKVYADDKKIHVLGEESKPKVENKPKSVFQEEKLKFSLTEGRKVSETHKK